MILILAFKLMELLAGLSMKAFAKGTNANGLLLQRVIYSCVVYLGGTLAMIVGNRPSAELLYRYTLQTRGYLNFHFSPGYRRIFSENIFI